MLRAWWHSPPHRFALIGGVIGLLLITPPINIWVIFALYGLVVFVLPAAVIVAVLWPRLGLGALRAALAWHRSTDRSPPEYPARPRLSPPDGRDDG